MPRFLFPGKGEIAGLVGADGRGRVSPAQIDGLPGEAENLALAKTEDQNQDISGVQRISGGASGFEKAPRLFTPP